MAFSFAATSLENWAWEEVERRSSKMRRLKGFKRLRGLKKLILLDCAIGVKVLIMVGVCYSRM